MLGKYAKYSESYKSALEGVFSRVNKPCRYVGGEYNEESFSEGADVKWCMCFPDMYEIGMSNLGIRILYHMLNGVEGVNCGRCFAPDRDMIDIMKKENVPLFVLEDRSPLLSCDILGFSVQYELLYSNILLMFELAGIPFYAKDRGDEYPLVIAGGPCMVNPEPIADFFDLMSIGEGEECLRDLALLYKKFKKEGKSKAEFLSEAEKIEGIYVPSSFKTEIVNGLVCPVEKTVKKAVVKDFEHCFFPVKPIVPNMEIVHDRAVIELYRGCSNGCRFCQAGFYYRPIRYFYQRPVQLDAENCFPHQKKIINQLNLKIVIQKYPK